MATINRKRTFYSGTLIPTALTPDFDGIPQSLRGESRWVLWRLERKGNSWSKVPRQTHGNAASPADPATWSTFEAVRQAYVTGTFAGVGFALGEGYAGIDIDNCRDAVSGVVDAWAEKIVEKLGSYAEVSPSGTGLKVFVRGSWPTDLPHMTPWETGDVEVYDSGRYFAMTGRAFRNVEVVESPVGLDALADAFRAWVAERRVKKAKAPRTGRKCGPSADVELRARQYLAACPFSVSGEHGHDQLLWAARILVYGFDLPIRVALDILQTDFNPRCDPLWPMADLERKVREGDAGQFDKPRGWLLDAPNANAPTRHCTKLFGIPEPGVTDATGGGAPGDNAVSHLYSQVHSGFSRPGGVGAPAGVLQQGKYQ